MMNLKNIEEILTNWLELKTVISKRGLEKLEATTFLGCKVYSTPDSIDIDDISEINLSFVEDTNHDCPDRFSVTLLIEDLIMTDNEWIKYMGVLEEIKHEKRKQKLEIIKTNEYNNKLKEFNKLKNELGL